MLHSVWFTAWAHLLGSGVTDISEWDAAALPRRAVSAAAAVDDGRPASTSDGNVWAAGWRLSHGHWWADVSRSATSAVWSSFLCKLLVLPVIMIARIRLCYILLMQSNWLYVMFISSVIKLWAAFSCRYHLPSTFSCPSLTETPGGLNGPCSEATCILNRFWCIVSHKNAKK